MADRTTANALLKEMYPQKEVDVVGIKDNPLLALLDSKGAWSEQGGKYAVVPVIHGSGQGQSSTYSKAHGNRSSSASSIAFSVTMADKFQVGLLDHKLMMTAKANPQAFMDVSKKEIDLALANMKRSIELDLFRSGYGARGVVGSSSGSTITLATADDIQNFEIGQKVVFASAESTGALRDSGDTLTITGLTDDDGSGNAVITFSAAVSGISGLQNGDVIFLEGDRQDSATPSRLCLAGLEAWVPYTAPSASESFFGVDRSVNSQRLAGVRVDASALQIDEALLKLGNKLARVGGRPDLAFVSWQNWEKLNHRLMGKGQVDVSAVGDAGIGFRAIEVACGAGVVKVLASHACPNNRLFMVQRDTWHLLHAGSAVVELVKDDGDILARVDGSNAFEYRIASYLNLACSAPGFNGVAKLA